MICVDQIGAAGWNDPVDDCVAQSQSGLGFLLFKGNDAVVVGFMDDKETGSLLHPDGYKTGIQIREWEAGIVCPE